MNNPPASILIAALPGPMQTALQALFSSPPDTYTIMIAEDPTAVLQIVTHAPPHLVIVTSDLLKRWDFSPEAIRKAAPSCPIAVLADDIRRTPAKFLKADLVLQQGAPPAELVAELEQLLAISFIQKRRE